MIIDSLLGKGGRKCVQCGKRFKQGGYIMTISTSGQSRSFLIFRADGTASMDDYVCGKECAGTRFAKHMHTVPGWQGDLKGGG